MKILLTHGYFLAEDSKEKSIMRPYPPLGILSISAYLDQNGIQHDIFDSTFSSKNDLYHFLTGFSPRYLCIYVNLMTKLNVLEIIRFVRQTELLKDTHIILGGPDVRYYANEYLSNGADYLVLGEGEVTLLELLRSLESSEQKMNDERIIIKENKSTENSIRIKETEGIVKNNNFAGTRDTGTEAWINKTEEISGIAYRDSLGQIIITEERSKIPDLDLLPFPNRCRIDLRKYLTVWKHFHGYNAISVSTMRGCPYSCRWCSRAVYGMSYRRRSPKMVADELESIRDEYNPDTIWFVDDVFTVSHKWLEGFSDELQKRGFTIPYECITRSDRLNEDVIRLLKKSGCIRLWIGAESGSQKIINFMDRRVNVEQVRDMIRLAKKYKIETGTFIMLGYPGETESDIEETIRHLKDSLPDHFTITIAYPIKGTEFYYEVEKDLVNEFEFEKDTDRNRNFKRTYRRSYYNFAVRRVHSEYNYYKLKMNNKQLTASAVIFKTISIVSKMGMLIEKIRSEKR